MAIHGDGRALRVRGPGPRILAMLISLAACGSNKASRQPTAPPEPSCAEVAMRVERLAPERSPEETDALRRRCTDEGWTVDDRRCVTGATSLDDTKRCFDHATKAEGAIPPPRVEAPLDQAQATKCPREDRIAAPGHSYQDLRLVGILRKGEQRKALLIDSTNLGHMIKRGDCVGRERAVVTEIGTESISFEIHGGAVQLFLKRSPASSLPSGTTVAP